MYSSRKFIPTVVLPSATSSGLNPVSAPITLFKVNLQVLLLLGPPKHSPSL